MVAPRKKDIAGVLHVTGKGFLFINQFGRNVFSSGFAAFWWKGSLRIAGGKESLIRRWIWKTGRLGWGNGFWQFHDLSIS